MSVFGEAIGLCVLAGAARADGDESQVEQLRDRLPGVVRGQYVTEGDASAVRAVIREVMGEEWRPSGAWAAQLDALGCAWPLTDDSTAGVLR